MNKWWNIKCRNLYGQGRSRGGWVDGERVCLIGRIKEILDGRERMGGAEVVDAWREGEDERCWMTWLLGHERRRKPYFDNWYILMFFFLTYCWNRVNRLVHPVQGWFFTQPVLRIESDRSNPQVRSNQPTFT